MGSETQTGLCFSWVFHKVSSTSSKLDYSGITLLVIGASSPGSIPPSGSPQPRLLCLSITCPGHFRLHCGKVGWFAPPKN